MFTLEDKLNREKDILNMMDIIDKKEMGNSSSKSFSLAINAKTGNGKTYLIRLWEQWLHMDENMNNRVIYYNAWEYDDGESPLLPLLYNIISITENEDEQKFIECAKLFLKTCGMATVRLGVKKFFGEDIEISDIVNEGIEQMSDSKIKTVFDEYHQQYGHREVMMKKLQEIVPSNGKLWMFVDELDRCRPDFAIKTLEVIKHYFDISGLIFVFSVDFEQLSRTIESVYGKGIDTDSYLKNHFDFIYYLSVPDIKAYISEKKEIYAALPRNIINYLCTIFSKFEYSLRDIDITINHILYFFKRYHNHINDNDGHDIALQVYLFFIVVKDKCHIDYQKILHGKFSMSQSPNGKYPVLNEKFIVTPKIKELLIEISEGKADKQTQDLIRKYNLFQTSENTVFSRNVEKVLNYLVE